MNKAAHEFDPNEVLREHKKFFEDNRAAFSPMPKRILTPNESDEKNSKLRPSDPKDYYSVMPKQQTNPLPSEGQSYYEESPEGKNKELLIMTIEIGDGNKDTLRVFEQDDPYDLARRFCEAHKLNPRIIEPLAHNIYANMEKVLEERAQALDEEKNNEEVQKKENGEVFKDLGMRTGEFRGFGETNHGYQQQRLQQQSQHQQQHQYQQQQQQQQKLQQTLGQQQYQQQYQQQGLNMSQDEDIDLDYNQQQQQQLQHQYQQQQQQQHQQQQQSQQQKLQQTLGQQQYQPQYQQQGMNISQEDIDLDYSKEQNSKEAEREYAANQSLSYPDRSADVSQAPWEPQEKDFIQPAGFHMRPSFDGKYMKFNNSQNTTNIYDGTTTQHEDASRNITSKVLDTTQRRTQFDYPSDFRMQNSSYLPETFQNEEEYLEYLIASQYGGNQKHDTRSQDCTFKPQINQTSKIMLENKYQNSRLSVYDRLHNHAKNKVVNSKKAPAQSDISPRRSTGTAPRKSVGTSRNETQRGVGLYQRGMKRKEELQRMLSDFKNERILEEERSCTFKPYINPISAEIVNSKHKYEPVENSLINYGRATHEKLERARSIQKIREVEGCTFQPMINSISSKLVSRKESLTPEPIRDRFTKLYYDHRVREANQESRAKALLSQSGCTFTPMINNYSEAIIERTSFEDRARKFAKKVAKIDDLRRQREELELFDPETGQPLFRPSIGRSPQKQKRERKQSIGDHLYNQRFEKENLRKSLCDKEKKARNASAIRTSEKSKLIMENIQRTKLQMIFNLLDSDEDGYISSSKIDIGSIGTDVLETFAPLLCEMEELNQTLSLADFIEAAERLLKTIPVHERDRIIMAEHFDRRSSQIAEHSFHPEINKKSARIAKGVRPYGNFDALYNRYIDEKHLHEEKIRIEQERKKEDELRECSFKPMRMPDSNMPLMSMNNYNYYYVDHLI